MVEFCISDGVGADSLSKRPSDVPSSCTTENPLRQWKVSPGMGAEEKKMASYERRVVSLGIDVTHGDFPIAASEAHLGNSH